MSYPYRLFLDDLREPPDVGMLWIVCRSFDEAVGCVRARGVPFFISFDHDLGDGPTGHDFAKWLTDHVLDGNALPAGFRFQVHSANPVGAENIRRLLTRFLAFIQSEPPDRDRPQP